MGVSGRQYILRLFIIHFFSCLGWLCNLAVAQFESGEAVTGSANFPDLGFAIAGNFLVFVTSLLRGRLDLELGARDVLATWRGPELYPINAGFGLTTCAQSPEPENRFAKASVVMLSYNPPNSSMKQFMKYICNAYKVDSILLQCFPLKSQSANPTESAELLPGICNCNLQDCKCIVFWNVQDIVKVLDQRMPGSLKRLSDSLCLLPSPECLENGCHGWKEERKKEKQAVNEIFEYVSQGAMQMEHPCICIPLSPSGYDNWGQLLNRSLGGTFSKGPPFTVPRLTEVLLNIVLTGWFRVDGLSSALVARRAIRDYVVQGGGFAAYAFLAEAYNQGNYQCWVLNFRGSRSGIRTFSFMIGCANLICFISWVVLVSSQGWYDSRANPPSKLRVVMMMVTIGIALGMDCLHLYVRGSRQLEEFRRRNIVRAVIILEIMYILFGIIIIPSLGIKVVGRWFYGALQVLVGLKWLIGSYLLGDHPSAYDHHFHYDFDNGILVYSSAFLLNCVLAGVRCNWSYSISPSYI